MPPKAVLLFTDATILRWFPPLRYTWAFRGEQAQVRITGENAKRVLFAAINLRTGHRLILRRFRQRQEDFQEFLRYLRHHYGGRPLGLLLDKASCHQAAGSQRLAAQMKVTFLWLPKHCPELNPQDQLWRELKRLWKSACKRDPRLIVANRQFQSLEEEARKAERWFLDLSPGTARRKAGILSGTFWLREFM